MRCKKPKLELSANVAKIVAGELGESVDSLYGRGPSVLKTLYRVFESTSTENRKSLPVILNHIRLGGLVFDKLQNGQTDDFIADNPESAKVILDEIRIQQQFIDHVHVKCEKALENEGSQGPA